MISLFRHYPRLEDKLPYISLGKFPTPIERLNQLGRDIGVDYLYVKRDDLSGKPYGGNKVRKLEFLLGHALRTKMKEVLVFGFAGSNLALTTAIYAQRLGLRSVSMLMPQPNAHYVRRNLLMSYYYGAELHQFDRATLRQILQQKLKHGQSFNVIPPGGSSPLGVVGYVNAAFELKDQIIKKEIPEPSHIYIASASSGTAIGLALGLKAAGLKARVIAVRVSGKKSVNTKKATRLFYETNSFLCSRDSSFLKFKFFEKSVDIRHNFFGRGYGYFTEKGMKAVAYMKEKEGIGLEGTYTGKAFAVLLDDAKKQELKNKVVLFWNTHDSRDFSNIMTFVDYHHLPRSLHYYFEKDVQPKEKFYVPTQ